MARILHGDHCRCGACGAYFNSTYAFDKHRVGEHGVSRRCLTEPELLHRKMAVNAGGWWIGSKKGSESLSRVRRSGDQAQGKGQGKGV